MLPEGVLNPDNCRVSDGLKKRAEEMVEPARPGIRKRKLLLRKGLASIFPPQQQISPKRDAGQGAVRFLQAVGRSEIPRRPTYAAAGSRRPAQRRLSRTFIPKRTRRTLLRLTANSYIPTTMAKETGAMMSHLRGSGMCQESTT